LIDHEILQRDFSLNPLITNIPNLSPANLSLKTGDTSDLG
jgi:hypothetical protein